MTSYPAKSPQTQLLPNFCALETLFPLVVIGELLAFVLVLKPGAQTVGLGPGAHPVHPVGGTHQLRCLVCVAAARGHDVSHDNGAHGARCHCRDGGRLVGGRLLDNSLGSCCRPGAPFA